MDFKKNQEVILKIDDLGNNGEGIGHVDGYALFVSQQNKPPAMPV